MITIEVIGPYILSIIQRLGLLLSFVAINMTLTLVTFLVCRHGFVHESFFSYSMDPCVVAVSRVLLKLIFVPNLASDFFGVDSVINFLCTSCTFI